MPDLWRIAPSRPCFALLYGLSEEAPFTSMTAAGCCLATGFCDAAAQQLSDGGSTPVTPPGSRCFAAARLEPESAQATPAAVCKKSASCERARFDIRAETSLLIFKLEDSYILELESVAVAAE